MTNTKDVRSGSIAYNRLDMQISQVFHLAIELYDSLDFLFVLDHHDDITLYDDEMNDGVVSYYQMKTTDNSITIHTALNEGWISKLYSHLNTPDIFVKELGFITNCHWKLENQTTSAEKTLFSTFNDESVEKIKKDIASRFKIDVKEVDLSKMVHMRTTLSIDRHKDIVQTEVTNFLCEKFSQIKVQTVKTIIASVFELLNRKQGYERLSEDSKFNVIKDKKGFSKSTFNHIIRFAIKINIPEFTEIQRFGQIPKDKEEKAALAYTQILADSSKNLDLFSKTFDEMETIIKDTPMLVGETSWIYINRCRNLLETKMPKTMFMYTNSLYLEVLAICIKIAESEGSL